MGTVTKLRMLHARDSALTRARCNPANRSNVKPFTLLTFAKPITANQCSGGMRPRARQLLTTGAGTPIPSATAVVPPRSLMRVSMDIGEPYFTKREVVKGHDSSGDFDPAALALLGMIPPFKMIGDRLLTLREWRRVEQKVLCAEIDVQPNQYSPFEQGHRRITLDVAIKLVEQYGVTLDWIYLNDMRGMTGQMQAELRNAERTLRAA